MVVVGNLIGTLSIVNNPSRFAVDIKRNAGAIDKQFADACQSKNLANSHPNDLIKGIDGRLNMMGITGLLQKLYKQGSTKMFDSAPATNSGAPRCGGRAQGC